ncbi:hypothetical protein V5O48_004924 [Marasmius crinis-equi]|uniref:Uncharacterized protein n=1 Tax=Marasmius crinis-equi TaxID=585013 RepID=A0ABR3FNR9_9AGAR
MPLEIVDGADSHISYKPDGQWIPSNECSNDQTCRTANPQAQAQEASIEYQFRGTFIQVFGIVQNQPNRPQQCNNVSYTLDGTPQQFQLPLVSNAPNQLLFQLPESLEDKDHTLVIAVNLADCRYTFDHFAVQTSESAPPSPPSTTSQSAATSSIPAAPSSAPEHEANVGGIVGGTIAVIVSVGLVALILLFFRRKRRRLHEANARQTVTPFENPPKSRSNPKSHLNEPPAPAPQVPPAAAPTPAASLPLAQGVRPQSQSTYSVSAPPSYSKLYP